MHLYVFKNKRKGHEEYKIVHIIITKIKITGHHTFSVYIRFVQTKVDSIFTEWLGYGFFDVYDYKKSNYYCDLNKKII